MKHKNSWNQLKENQVANSLTYPSLSSQRITIPETLYKFFNVVDDKNINLLFNSNSGLIFSATIVTTKDKRRELIWYQHLAELIVRESWWKDIKNNNSSSNSQVVLGITKTYNQKDGYGADDYYGKCDVYNVSVGMEFPKKAKSEISALNTSKKATSEIPFGHIDGIKEGKLFANRKDLGLSGIHAPPQAGIWGRQNEGTASIVLSGGYADDVDDWDYILYTGQGGQDVSGGKQVRDQEFTLGNRALQLNKEYNLPVRVTRGYQVDKGPEKGYRYDGLYYVTDYERVKGKEGFQICRFYLQKENRISVEVIEEPTSPADRAPYSGDRLKRNVKLAEQIKKLYNNTCQVCNIFLKTPINGFGISEAAHIKAIGKPHNGPDTKANMFCLCPNHHAQFDSYSFYIEPENFEIVGLEEYEGQSITKKHKINPKYFEYHKEQYLKKN